MTPVQILAVWVIVSVIATPFLGEWLHNRRVNREFKSLLERNRPKSRPLHPSIVKSDSRWTDEAFALDEPSQPRSA